MVNMAHLKIKIYDFIPGAKSINIDSDKDKTDIDSLITSLNEAKNMGATHVEVTSSEYSIELIPKICRDETELEKNQRETLEKRRKALIEQNERANYERLKQKFEKK